jgi:drug/metabolite transporter (DMT)-like permease
MDFRQISAIATVVLIFPVGQLLFKTASKTVVFGDGLLVLIRSMFNIYLVAALLLYGFGTVVWLYVLSRSSLGGAYPFIALSFIIVPVLGHLFLDEQFSTNYVLGLLLVLVGLYFIVR